MDVFLRVGLLRGHESDDTVLSPLGFLFLTGIIRWSICLFTLFFIILRSGMFRRKRFRGGRWKSAVMFGSAGMLLSLLLYDGSAMELELL
jgi:hypothetical protein